MTDAGRGTRSLPVAATVDGPVARITLACGQAGNPLGPDAQRGLVDAAAAVRETSDARVVLLAAEGRRFSIGAPLDGPAEGEGIEAIAALEQPVVVAVQGEARGLGLALVLAADVVVADPRVRLRATGSGRADARLPGGGLVQRLTRVVGPTRASEMLLLGTTVGARTGLAWGLVQRVSRPGRVRAAATRLARELARQGPLAMRYAKEACRRALDLPLDDGLRLEHDLYVMLQTTADRQAGVQAFLERRRPEFTGQ